MGKTILAARRIRTQVLPGCGGYYVDGDVGILYAGTPDEQFSAVFADAAHCYVRPFDYATLHEQPVRGSVHYLVVQPRKASHLRVLAAIALTPHRNPAMAHPGAKIGGKLLLFPGTGQDMVRRVSEGPAMPASPIHHMTYEEREDGRVRVHLSSPRDPQGTKARLDDATTLAAPLGADSLLLTMLVKRPAALDPAGLAYVRRPVGRRTAAGQLDEEIGRCVAAEHPFVEAPGSTPWVEGHHLQASLFISRERLAEDDRVLSPLVRGDCFQVRPQLPPERHVRHTSVRLGQDTYLKLTLEVLPGVPKGDFILVHAREAPRAGPRRRAA